MLVVCLFFLADRNNLLVSLMLAATGVCKITGVFVVVVCCRKTTGTTTTNNSNNTVYFANTATSFRTFPMKGLGKRVSWPLSKGQDAP